MVYYDPELDRWVLSTGDLAYWLDDDSRPVRVRIELVTSERVYLVATAGDQGKRKGQVWYEARVTRRVVPRAAYIRGGRAHFDADTVLIVD